MSLPRAIELPRPADEIWAWMAEASSNIDIFGAELATTLPGTPRGGVGEIQAVVLGGDEARATLSQVVELSRGRRAVTRRLGFGHPTGATLTVDPLGQRACRVTHTFTAELPAGIQAFYVHEVRQEFTSTLRTLTQRLLELHPPAPDEEEQAAG